jgi:hypothetical protein
MRQVRYRAVIALDPALPGTPRHIPVTRHPFPVIPYPNSRVPEPALPEGVYLSHTHELMLRSESRLKPGAYRTFSAELCWDDEENPLHPGDRHVVTVTLTDDDAPGYFGAGQPFTLWSGRDVGHGTISRRVFSEHGPC